MTKTEMKKQKSEQWKKDNDWGLTVEQRSAKREVRARKAIQEKLNNGKDASILIDLFEDAFGKKF